MHSVGKTRRLPVGWFGVGVGLGVVIDGSVWPIFMNFLKTCIFRLNQ